MSGYNIDFTGKKVGDIVKEQECKVCSTKLIKRAVDDTYKGGLKASAWLDPDGNSHLERKGNDYICKKTGDSITGKKGPATEWNDKSKIHVDTHSHETLAKSMLEIKEKLVELSKEIKTYMEREKQ